MWLQLKNRIENRLGSMEELIVSESGEDGSVKVSGCLAPCQMGSNKKELGLALSSFPNISCLYG